MSAKNYENWLTVNEVITFAAAIASEGIMKLGVTLCVCPPSRGDGIALRLECFYLQL